MRSACLVLAMLVSTLQLANAALAAATCIDCGIGYHDRLGDALGDRGGAATPAPLMCSDRNDTNNAAVEIGHRRTDRDRSDASPSVGDFRQASSEPTPFCKGYAEGFRRGYCGSDMPCRGGERRWCRSSYYLPQTYEAGYARGLEDGKTAREQIPGLPPVDRPTYEDEDDDDDWRDGTCDRCERLPSPGESPQPQPHP